MCILSIPLNLRCMCTFHPYLQTYDSSNVSLKCIVDREALLESNCERYNIDDSKVTPNIPTHTPAHAHIRTPTLKLANTHKLKPTHMHEHRCELCLPACPHACPHGEVRSSCRHARTHTHTHAHARAHAHAHAHPLPACSRSLTLTIIFNTPPPSH